MVYLYRQHHTYEPVLVLVWLPTRISCDGQDCKNKAFQKDKMGKSWVPTPNNAVQYIQGFGANQENMHDGWD